MSAISSIVIIPIASSNTEALTTVARAAELTEPRRPVTAEDEPTEAKSLRPGRAARAVVADGRAVHDAIEAVLAAPGESREVARRAYEAVRDRLVADALDVDAGGPAPGAHPREGHVRPRS